MHRHVALLALCALTASSTQGCKRKPARGESPAVPVLNAQLSQPPQPLTAAPALAPAARNPLWPQWLPVVDGVERRMSGSDIFEGIGSTGALLTLINARRAFELQGYALSQTTIRRQSYEQRFIFSASRGAEFTRVEIVGYPSRPNFSSMTATTGSLARTMASRSR